MKKGSNYHLNVKIDKLTNSIENAISGDSFKTEVIPVNEQDIQKIKATKGWLFNWKSEIGNDEKQVFKLTIKDNPDIIQGLVSLSDNHDHILVHLIENAPFNRGKTKLYKGVAGNLFAFSCKISFEKGYEGFVVFYSKTKLIKHYSETLGAIPSGGLKMIIFPDKANKLLQKYFNN